jgi:hypothetical protein
MSCTHEESYFPRRLRLPAAPWNRLARGNGGWRRRAAAEGKEKAKVATQCSLPNWNVPAYPDRPWAALAEQSARRFWFDRYHRCFGHHRRWPQAVRNFAHAGEIAWVKQLRRVPLGTGIGGD